MRAHFLCDEDEVLTTESAFIGFQVLARSRGVKYRAVANGEVRTLRPSEVAALVPWLYEPVEDDVVLEPAPEPETRTRRRRA